MTKTATRHFEFRFDRPARYLLAALGITPRTSGVDVGRRKLRIRFGPWRLAIDRRNVRSASVAGPFSPWRAIGPRLSLADRGVTFGTTTRAGVCVALWRPVAALAPRRLLTHPAITLTVDRPAELARLLKRGRPGPAVRAVRQLRSFRPVPRTH